jgi:hypothetical protein
MGISAASLPKYHLLQTGLFAGNSLIYLHFYGFISAPNRAVFGAEHEGKAHKSMVKSNLRLVTPGTDFGAVPAAKPPRKRPNAEVRSREYLTEAEVERLIEAAKGNRHSHRDATMILVTFRHGLRTAEVTRLRWDAIDLDRAELHVARAKNGKPATPPHRAGAAGTASAQARAGPGVIIRLCLGAWRAVRPARLPADDRTASRRRQVHVSGARPHVAPRLRLRVGQRRSSDARAARLPRPQEYSAHRTVHRTVADEVQGLLEGLRMAVVDLKPKKRRHAPRDLVPIDRTSGAARFYDKMRRDIAADLGGRRTMSRIESELVKGFCGCATRLEYLNYQILLGEAAEADVASYAQLASTMLRIGARLGLSRRAKDVTPPTLEEYLRARRTGEPAEEPLE